jgi:hypothetical protein
VQELISPDINTVIWLYSPLIDLSHVFQFIHAVHTRKDPFDGGSASFKSATYTQEKTNTQTPTPSLGFGSIMINRISTYVFYCALKNIAFE